MSSTCELVNITCTYVLSVYVCVVVLTITVASLPFPLSDAKKTLMLHTIATTNMHSMQTLCMKYDECDYRSMLYSLYCTWLTYVPNWHSHKHFGVSSALSPLPSVWKVTVALLPCPKLDSKYTLIVYFWNGFSPSTMCVVCPVTLTRLDGIMLSVASPCKNTL